MPGCWMSTRRGGRVVRDRPRLRGPAPAGDPHRGGPRPGEGVHPAASPAGHGGRGRLRGAVGAAGRGAGQVLPVRVPDVVFRQGRAPGVGDLRAGGLPGRPRARVHRPGRRPGRADPVRQPDPGRDEGAAEGPGADREPAVDGVPVALPVRGVLLRAGHRGSAREGRRRGPGRVLPPQSPGPGPGSGLARGAERADRRRRGGRGRPADRGADPHHRPGLRRRGARGWSRCRTSRSRPGCC